MKHKISLFLAAATATKEAVAATMAATTSVAAITLAPALGFEPWTWVLGATGGAIAQVFIPADKKKPEPNNRMSKTLAWLHGRKLNIIVVLISIILAGVGSEYVVRVFFDQKWTVPNIHVTAFVLALVWPFLAQLAWKKALKWSES
jgi:hypothetical protein